MPRNSVHDGMIGNHTYLSKPPIPESEMQKQNRNVSWALFTDSFKKGHEFSLNSAEYFFLIDHCCQNRCRKNMSNTGKWVRI